MRSASAGYFDAADALPWDAVPINPAAKRIIEREAITQHQSTTGPARSQTAQRSALRGWVRGAAGGATEETEPGHLAEDVVGSKCSCCSQVLSRENGDTGRVLNYSQARAIGRDGNLLGRAGRQEDYTKSVRAALPIHIMDLKSLGGNAHDTRVSGDLGQHKLAPV